MTLIKKLNYIFDKKQKWHIFILFFVISGSAMLELLGVSIIMPFVSVITNPELLVGDNVYGIIYKKVGFRNESQFVIAMALCLIGVYVIKNAYAIVMYDLQYKFTYNNQRRLALRLVNCYMNQTYLFHLSKNVSELQRNVIDDVSMFFLAVLGVIQLFTEMLISLLLVVYLIFVDKIITCSIIVFLGVFVFTYLKVFRRKSLHWGALNRESNVIRNKWIKQAFEGIKEIKIVNRESFFIDQIDKYYKQFADAVRKQQIISNIPKPIFEAACVTSFMVVVIIEIYRGTNLRTFIPVISAFAIAAFRLLPSFSRITSNINSITYNSPAVNAVYEDLLEANMLVKNTAKYKKNDNIIEFNKDIIISGVSFGYPNTNRSVLDDVSLQIPVNKSVAFIGPSGAGKTTLADLILGILTPNKGEIKVDGVDIGDNMYAWHEHLGYIPQNIYLMDDTIRNNILFGIPKDEADDNLVWEALKNAQLSDFVKSLDDGLDTMIGERGVRLSGGQRQRIGIARALYNNPKLLVLDEATSALDNDTETAVMEAIDELKGKKTLIIIAHRLTTIRNCDIVFEIVDGKVNEINHRE